MDDISFHNTPADYRQVLLDCIGAGQLRNLSFFYAHHIDPIVEFLPCSHLEKLVISMDSDCVPLVDSAAFALRVPAEILADYSCFLPNLKVLSTLRCCFGEWSRLFECYRPLLTKLKLSCSHIGVPSKNVFSWQNIPILWPHLKELYFNNTSGLSVEMVSQIFPRFAYLEYLGISNSMLPSAEERRLARVFSAQMLGRVQQPLHVSFLVPPVDNDCPCYF